MTTNHVSFDPASERPGTTTTNAKAGMRRRRPKSDHVFNSYKYNESGHKVKIYDVYVVNDPSKIQAIANDFIRNRFGTEFFKNIQDENKDHVDRHVAQKFLNPNLVDHLLLLPEAARPGCAPRLPEVAGPSCSLQQPLSEHAFGELDANAAEVLQGGRGCQRVDPAFLPSVILSPLCNARA